MFVQKIAVKCIIEEKGKILLMKESSKSSWKPGTWSLPGGKMDEKESFLDTFHREMQEETGLKVKISGLFEIEELIAEIENGTRLVHHFVFTGKRISGKLKDPDHHVAELKWFSKEEAEKIKVKDLAEFYYKDLFDKYFKNKNNLIDISKIKIWNAFLDKKFYDWVKD